MKWQAVEMLRSIMQYSQYPSCKQVSRYHKTSSRFKRLFWMQFLCPSWNLCPKTRCQQGLHDGLHLGCHNTQHFQLNSIELIKAAPETTHTSDCGEEKKTTRLCSCFCFYFFFRSTCDGPAPFFPTKTASKICGNVWHWSSSWTALRIATNILSIKTPSLSA